MTSFFAGLSKFFIGIVKLIVAFLSFIILLYSLTYGFALFNKQYYQPNDTPDARFQVVIVNEKGEKLPLRWEKFSQITSNTYQFVTQEDKDCIKYCLRKNDKGNFVYYNEGGGWQSESEYQITNGKILPVSFFMLHFGHMGLAFFCSFIGLAIGRYTIQRLWYRHSTQKIRELNKTALSQLKGFLMFIAIVVGFYAVVSLVNHA